MNSEYSISQQIAFDKYKEGHNIFITGPGGTGKSKLIKDIYNDARARNKEIQVCALTGCAAVLLECKAKTIHSWAGIGIATGTISNMVFKIIKSDFKRRNWKNIDILVIDEISMMSLKIFELLDEIGKKARNNRRPFGGIQLVFSGDFYQLPPVGNKDEIDTTRFCFESPLWKETFTLKNHIQLTEIFRQKDPVYAKILNEIREGKLHKSSCKILEEQVQKKQIANPEIYPTKLFPTRNKADMINQNEMANLLVDEIEMELKYVYDLPITEKEKQIRLQYNSEKIMTELQYIKNNLLCEEKLRLKIGCQVMCIVNIELPTGHMICNGSQGIVIRMSTNNLPVVKFNNGIEMVMGYHMWASETIPGIGISQIPLILAWALTIHKSQGATMDTAEIDIGNSIFECGQTYVALSRIKSLEGLYLTSFEPTKIRINKKVRDFYVSLSTSSSSKPSLSASLSSSNTN